MAKQSHPAHRHIQAAKKAMQDHSNQIMQHLANIEQAIGPQQAEGPPQQPGAPTGPSTGVTQPGGMSPMGGRAVG